ncbi:hypothetical protein MNB_SV-4-954 [hydrothermal vent metagenome]|uniref:Nucleotidyl transferase AbiEii toxin, Type IV TA system n=1 Tax=hydrothermal vent metagenome TaxID=652676 RepID=A0A1W1E724_9ZZZZ
MFVLSRAYRHSEDLDFFFPTLKDRKFVFETGERMAKLIGELPGATVEDIRRVKEENAFRLWCRFEDNDETVKVELLNFTCSRLKDAGFIKLPFKTENLYNILLYKLKALCDRPDTIKDLFDLYFIFRDLPPIETDELILDLNEKFESAIGLRYELGHLVRALEYHLKWDIEIADIAHPHDLKEEIENFQKSLHDALASKSLLDFSYKKRIQNNAAKYDLDEKSYLELIDVLDENAFWVNEVLVGL